ncbi:MAG: hypothetical protein OJF55_000152 [Rhodanobacteraceae bacterium]|jgi:hypothetical protein|nr:MAG: hypothetical protein OJF55_000152 [Rhodanobacteraceae bacterium]
MAQSETGEFHHDDPCSLLTTAEVEAALGTPLGTAPFRGSNQNPAPNGSDCVYMTRQFQTVTLSVEFDGGQQAYHIGDFVGNMLKGGPKGVVNDKAKQAMVSDAGEAIAGEWDEAKLTPMNCCIFNALRGDQMISIDFTGSTMSLKQAAGLVDAAFKRIGKPLSLDGGANVDAAKAFLKTRPQPQVACSVLTQVEVEAIVGKLAAAPKAGNDACTYELPHPAGYPPRDYELHFTWHDGNYDFMQDLQAARMAGAALGSMTVQESRTVDVPASGSSSSPSGVQTRQVTGTVSVDEASKRLTGQTFAQGMHLTGEQDTQTTGPWERAADAGMGFEAVKKDVLVKVTGFGGDSAHARALVAEAMKKF